MDIGVFTRSEIKRRREMIRAATPDVLENLFEMSNRVCDLCNQPIQDLLLAALEHSTPVIHFAKSPLTIEDAIAQAHHPNNLRVAHSHCNLVKMTKTRAKWFAAGLDKTVGEPRFYTDVELLELQFRLSARGSANARVAVEQKRGIHALHYDRIAHHEKVLATMGPEGLSERARKRARTLGLEGLAASNRKRARTLGLRGLSEVAKRANESRTPEERKEVTKRAKETMGSDGRSAAARKRAETIGLSRLSEIARKGKATMGSERRSAAARKRQESMGPEKRSEMMKKASPAGNHKHWHVNRGIKKEGCSLCFPVAA
jgi:hypothetical protein